MFGVGLEVLGLSASAVPILKLGIERMLPIVGYQKGLMLEGFCSTAGQRSEKQCSNDAA